MRTCSRVLAVAAVSLLAACGRPTTLPTVEYLCTDRTALRVTFVENAASVLMASGYAVQLPQQMAGSGFRYADERHELRGKGNDITWTLGNSEPLHCSAPGS